VFAGFSFKISCARHSNYQSPGEYINRPSQIYFDGKLTNNDFDINGGKSFIAKGEWEV
jgi:trans-2,3-dihydro-3-hydroxyanthranilate isomerase